MIRIDALWLAVEPIDMRAESERLLARGAGLRRSSVSSRLLVLERPPYAHEAIGA